MNKLILDNLATGVVVVDKQLQLLYINTAAENLLEVSFQQARGQNINSIFASSGNWSDEIQRVFKTASGFSRRQANMQLASSFRHITVDYTVSPMFEPSELSNANQSEVLYVLIEMQAMDRLLRISREEALVSSEQTSRTLIRGLAHEIKNPLGGIRGAAQLLSRELKDPSHKDYTTVIIEEADRLRNLVDRMLGINKPLQLEKLNVHEVLERVSALTEVELTDGINLVRDYDPSIPEIRGDKEQLIQVVLNIVRNAVQALSHVEKNKRKITLKTRTQHHFTIGQKQHRLVCRIDIIDNGSGIPPEIAQNIFYPLISGRAEGTGLGLAIAQSIIIQHHGLIECESKPGVTVFSIYLPFDK
jgi:two-component system nitrogen regulation sensor histidine kinase GlnL